MATKPVAWQEQGPVDSLGEGINEFWAQGGVGATLSHDSPQPHKEAPKAEPEEDIDVLEPGAPYETLQENRTLPGAKTAHATKFENQELGSLCTPRETQKTVTELEQLSEAFQAQEESEKSADPFEDALPPPASISALSTEKCFEEESSSSLEGEVSGWITGGEIISDPTEDLMSSDSQTSQEWPPLLTEPVNREVDSSSGEMKGDNMTTKENDVQLHFLPDGFDNSEAEMNMLGAAHHSPSDINYSDDVYTVCSPPFADESEEEEEGSICSMSCQQQWTTLDVRGKPVQHSYSANISIFPEQHPTATLLAVLSAKQQEEMLCQSLHELIPRGENQEAAQQVLGQSFSPLSSVAMELSNRGGAASQASGCVVAVGERHSRAGERAEGESKQTGGEGGQKESGLEGNKAVEQQYGTGLFKFAKTAQTKEVKTEHSFVSSKHIRMESDLCDDSQCDSGITADFSPCSTLESNATLSTGTPAAVPKETPIEREIRRAIEREHSLRRSRGLPNPPTSPEYVEIPLRKTVLCQSVPAKSERCQGKDRLFAGKKMQHEIHEEAQREQDLVKLGKVPGFYDKGTVRQVKERKQLFEAFQKPSDSTFTVSVRSNATSCSSVSDISTMENKEDNSSQASNIGGSYVEGTQSRNLSKEGGAPRGPGFSEGKACQVIILENNLSVPAPKLYHTKPEAEPVTIVDSASPNISTSRAGGHSEIKVKEQRKEDQEEVEPKENPFFKLRSSKNVVKVEQDIREAQKREKDLHKQRISLYGGTKGAKGEGGGRPVSTEEKSPTLSSSSSVNGLVVPDLPGSSSRGGTRTTAAHQSVGKFGVWPPGQAGHETINRPEVLQSPRSPRQKTPLVQQWESGLVNGHNVGDD